MKPEMKSYHLLNITKSKAKMWEYDIPKQDHIKISENPDKLFSLSVALLGDVAAEINRKHENNDSFIKLKEYLKFSAEFLNSFYEAKLIETLSSKLRLLASAAYYLCDMPGNAKVLADSIKYDELNTRAEGLNTLLLWILQSNLSIVLEGTNNDYAFFIKNLPLFLLAFYENGNPEAILQLVDNLRQSVYTYGTDEQLLLGDIIAAVTRKKIENASICVLPSYTDIDILQWQSALSKQTFIREFWPAQHLFGKAGILRGQSAVVQMPTSAGKTKSTELILRSAFLSHRTNLAIIIAPFRALCHEITDTLKESFQNEPVGIDTLSDVLQNDYNLASILGFPTKPQVLIVTPEKLLYVLRQHPVIAEHLRLIVFDEGHQFDTGKRGITYELLIASLKRFIPADAQKILISAVIQNAQEIGDWLNGQDIVIKGNALLPTSKLIGFVSWIDTPGQIKYIENSEEIFFVPRVIETHTLKLKGRERTERIFPEMGNAQDNALFLGLKLCAKGGVAIFCGNKITAGNICKRIAEIVARGYSIMNLQEISDNNELLAISMLCENNLGTESIEAKSAKLGVLAHHGNIPHGIRLAVEHAVREDKARIVVCTSTLAQGVNLPIRYLIFTKFYQGQETIKNRDFHNLIGRAGRAGKHIEGSILFAESKIYDGKYDEDENWRWNKVQDLMDMSKSEDCASSLLAILDPIHNKWNEQEIIFGKGIESFEGIINAYIKNQMKELAKNISEKFENDSFDFETVFNQLFLKQQLLESLENFILAHWEYINENTEDSLSELAQQTLAFHMADEDKREQIIKVFKLLSNNITQTIPDINRIKAFGKTLYGINNALKIETWVNNYQNDLMKISDIETFVETTWNLFCEIIENNINKGLFVKFDLIDVRKDILLAWLSGKSFAELMVILNERGVRKISGSQKRFFTVEDMVDICENTFSFEGMLFVGAITEFLSSFDNFDQQVKEQFQIFQKKFKYGLPSLSAINVYELGFSDRFLSQKIASLFQNQNLSREDILHIINDPNILNSIQDLCMPSYYHLKLKSLLEK